MEETRSTKKKTGPNPTAEMGFWDHIEQLRWHLVKASIAIVAGTVLAFLNRHFIFDTVLLGPKTSGFPTLRLLCQLGEYLGVSSLCLDNSGLSIININMSGQFMTLIYVSLVSGLVLAFPYVVYELWKFVKPALLERERKHSAWAVTVISLLFLTGVAFSYFLIVPLTINFLGTYQVSEAVANQVSLNSYISTVVSVTLAVGIVFELPALAYVLARLGVVSAQMMRKYRKVMIVVIFVVAAIITPPDVFSQVMVAIPLLLLYEGSIWIAARAGKSRNTEASA